MKKITLFASALLLFNGAQAQIFSDDFESYAVGSYIGPQSTQWRTWSAGGEGTSEDVQVTDAQASSGTKAIYFSSTAANGGPQDVVLDFGMLYNSGEFTYQSDIYVNANKSGYFNIQGANAIGGSYALDVFMENGTISVQNAGVEKLLTPYASATWFTMTIVANLTTKIWEMKIDGVSVGKWTNAVNTVRYVDLYPIQGSQFYVDDVSFDQTAYTAGTLNASAADLKMGGNFASQTVSPILTIKNTGSTAITSLDVTFNYNGNNVVENVTGLNVAAGTTTNVTINGITLVAGANIATATISNVNGTTDDIATDNSSSLVIDPLVPALGKMVVSEEGTGTWCGWCPRGTVAMENFQADFGDAGFWAGVAIHNGDVMTVEKYDTGMGFSSFPGSKVDRGTTVDPSQMTPSFQTRIQTDPTAFVEIGASYDNTTQELQVSGTFDFQQAATNGYKVAFVLTEDGVTGGSGYAQTNYYSSQSQNLDLIDRNGLNYKTLPNPIPAAQMVYDHVARRIEPSFGGFAGSFPATVPQGSSETVYYVFKLDPTWDVQNLHIIVMLIAPNGTIDNAGRATIAEAVTTGYTPGGTFAGTDFSSLNELSQVDATFQVYPNPATTNVGLAFNLKSESQINVAVLDMSGKTIASRNYGSMNGASVINYNTTGLSEGIYLVEVTVNGEKMTRRLVIQ